MAATTYSIQHLWKRQENPDGGGVKSKRPRRSRCAWNVKKKKKEKKKEQLISCTQEEKKQRYRNVKQYTLIHNGMKSGKIAEWYPPLPPQKKGEKKEAVSIAPIPEGFNSYTLVSDGLAK